MRFGFPLTPLVPRHRRWPDIPPSRCRSESHNRMAGGDLDVRQVSRGRKAACLLLRSRAGTSGKGPTIVPGSGPATTASAGDLRGRPEAEARARARPATPPGHGKAGAGGLAKARTARRFLAAHEDAALFRSATFSSAAKGPGDHCSLLPSRNSGPVQHPNPG